MELNETKSAIVTGGASGLGAAVARRLAAAFVQVSIFDTNADQGRVSPNRSVAGFMRLMSVMRPVLRRAWRR